MNGAVLILGAMTPGMSMWGNAGCAGVSQVFNAFRSPSVMVARDPAYPAQRRRLLGSI